jgi:hypothetical protein
MAWNVQQCLDNKDTFSCLSNTVILTKDSYFKTTPQNTHWLTRIEQNTRRAGTLVTHAL